MKPRTTRQRPNRNSTIAYSYCSRCNAEMSHSDMVRIGTTFRDEGDKIISVPRLGHKRCQAPEPTEFTPTNWLDHYTKGTQ